MIRYGLAYLFNRWQDVPRGCICTFALSFHGAWSVEFRHLPFLIRLTFFNNLYSLQLKQILTLKPLPASLFG
jgi:hypothetical protein